jgi:hypothetical protein
MFNPCTEPSVVTSSSASGGNAVQLSTTRSSRSRRPRSSDVRRSFAHAASLLRASKSSLTSALQIWSDARVRHVESVAHKRPATFSPTGHDNRIDAPAPTCQGDNVDKISLIRQGLEEARSMLAEMQGEAGAAALFERLKMIERRVADWEIHAPNRLDRVATINEVVTLKMDVSRLRRARTSGIISRGEVDAEKS